MKTHTEAADRLISDLANACRMALDNLDAHIRGAKPPHNELRVLMPALREALRKAEGFASE